MDREIYLVEVGVLYEKDDSIYSEAYDKKHAYYDENQFYAGNITEAKYHVNYYVQNGVINTYGIISKAYIDSSVLEEQDISEIPVSEEKYRPEDVVYSVYKAPDSQIITDFVKK